MADLIDRDAAIEAYCADCCSMFGTTICENGGMCRDIDVLKKIPAANLWISCSERLPEPLQTVIVCTNINTVTAAWINGDHWTFSDTGGGRTENWGFDAVKKWMPMPDAYEPHKGEQNEQS